MRKPPREWTFLEGIRKIIERPHPHVRVGWGDDAFVFRNFPGYSVLCQDMMVEDVHFKLQYSSAADLGHKALAVNLSDLAAMGARPHFVHVSIAIPQKINESWLDEFYHSMTNLADLTGCQVVGGDLTSSPDRLVIDVSVHGSCQDEPLTIQEGQPGDLILSSGPLGLSKVGLAALQKGLTNFPRSQKAHLRPAARLDLFSQLREKQSRIKGLTDCSDGFFQDVQSFIDFQKNGFEVLACPELIHPEVLHFANLTNQDPYDIVLMGGEDFELLLLIAAADISHFPNWHVMGKIISDPKFIISENGNQRPLQSEDSWEHF